MVLADPEPVGLGLGLGVVGGEVTDILDGGGDGGLAGEIQVRVSDGGEVFPWRNIKTQVNMGCDKTDFFFNISPDYP